MFAKSKSKSKAKFQFQFQFRAFDSMTLDQLQEEVRLIPRGRKREATLAVVDAWEARAAELAARGLDYWRQ